MIPTADLILEHRVDFDRLVAPNAEDVAYPGWAGIIHHHSSGLWHEASWEEAASLLETEARLTKEFDAKATFGEEFEALQDEVLSDEADLLMSGCDFGIGAAVWSLNAAGYVTASSCSGHENGGPQILLACDEQRARLLLDVTRKAGCGLQPAETGLQIWAASISGMLRLAEELISRRAEFDALPLPASRDWPEEEDS